METWFGPDRRAAGLLALAVAGLAGGLWAHFAGAGQLGDHILTLTVAAGLVPLAASVARALARREPGVDGSPCWPWPARWRWVRCWPGR